MNILAIGLDRQTLTALQQRKVSFTVRTIEALQDLENLLLGGEYEACIIDMDSTTSSLSLLRIRNLRSKDVRIPLLGISHGYPDTCWSDQRASFLECGGDDLLKKPVQGRELVASLHVMIRRFNFTLQSEVEYQLNGACLKVNLVTQQITLNGINPPLVGKEIGMVLLFVSTPNHLHTRDEILTRLHGHCYGNAPWARIVDVTVYRIRKKFNQIHPGAGELIRTISGRGYRLQSQIQTN